MNPGRPKIKEDTKRQVRQRCGFGCVVCGIPVYHYDHMDEYSVVQEHAAANITLLCANHHDLKTRGLLPVELVRAQNASPYNFSHGSAGIHHLFYYADNAEIVAGGNNVWVSKRSASAVKIDGDSLVDFELIDGILMLNLAFRDEDGIPVLTVLRNELVHSTHLWDYEFTGRRLTIREKKGKIYLTVFFEADKKRVVIEKGLVSHNRVDLLIDPRGLCILNSLIFLSGNSIAESDTAISVGGRGQASGPAAMHFDVDRHPYDRGAAIVLARQKMREFAKSSSTSPSERSRSTAALRSAESTTWLGICFLPFPWTRSSRRS